MKKILSEKLIKLILNSNINYLLFLSFKLTILKKI